MPNAIRETRRSVTGGTPVLPPDRRDAGPTQRCTLEYPASERPGSLTVIDSAAALDLHRTGRWTEAEAAYRELLAHAPTAALHQNLARLLLENGRFAEAMDALEAALALEPQSAELALLSGRVWVELGDLREAAQWFGRVLRLDPASHEARVQFGFLALDAGDPERAEATFRDVLAALPDHAAARNGLARALLDQGDADGAVG